MGTVADFYNDALGQCGNARITSENEGSVASNWCLTFWPKMRQSMLRLHFWNFAEARATLAENLTPPAFEFAHGYALPSDFIRIKEYNGENLITLPASFGYMAYPGRYKIEGKSLLTNDGSVKIVYVKDIVTPDDWDVLFYQTGATWLASKLAMAINKDTKKSASLQQQAIGMWLPLAAAVDGQEGTNLPYIVDDLIWGR